MLAWQSWINGTSEETAFGFKICWAKVASAVWSQTDGTVSTSALWEATAGSSLLTMWLSIHPMSSSQRNPTRKGQVEQEDWWCWAQPDKMGLASGSAWFALHFYIERWLTGLCSLSFAFGTHSTVELSLMHEVLEPQQNSSSAAGGLAGSITACKKVTSPHGTFFPPMEKQLGLVFQACFLM